MSSPRPTYALTRAIPRTLSSGQVLSPTTLLSLSLSTAESQHATYNAALTPHLASLLPLPALDPHPDSCFVEDTAVLLSPHIAVLTQPGHTTRRGETPSIFDALRKLPAPPSEIVRMEEVDLEAFADGGDVLCLGTHLVVGLSERTNERGAKVLCDAARRAGVEGVVVRCLAGRTNNLHLKCIVTAVDEDTVVIADTDVGRAVHKEIESLIGRPLHPLHTPSFFHANVLRLPPLVPLPPSPSSERRTVNGPPDCILVQMSAPAALKRALAEYAREVKEVDMSELGKVDGALTCCSLLWRP